jgi:hypothetical protein
VLEVERGAPLVAIHDLVEGVTARRQFAVYESSDPFQMAGRITHQWFFYLDYLSS